MSSINTNSSAMAALSTLRSINDNLNTTQNRISSGLNVESGKDNAAYFQISETMKSDSSVYSAINEGLTVTKSSVATARLGAETVQDLAQEFLDKVAFAQGATSGLDEIEDDLLELVKSMETTLSQSTFNGDDMLAAGDYPPTAGSIAGATGVLTSAGATTGNDRNVVTGVTRAGGTYATTEIVVSDYDIANVVSDFKTIATAFATNAGDATNGEAFLGGALASTEGVLTKITDVATKLGQSERSIETQQTFLKAVVDNIDASVGSMIDANMEEEAARLQALQVQQQLATQSLSIANQAPQNILSLFR
ncbi:flagellin [Marinovum sp.]|uniref:flagellin N-terminal helical domain-containing protein n=1 Tax=Marinovum sp. TaxID=2024839 RepID=UPI002B26D671|nr:flagellin [Marinovum sp.]